MKTMDDGLILNAKDIDIDHLTYRRRRRWDRPLRRSEPSRIPSGNRHFGSRARFLSFSRHFIPCPARFAPLHFTPLPRAGPIAYLGRVVRLLKPSVPFSLSSVGCRTGGDAASDVPPK